MRSIVPRPITTRGRPDQPVDILLLHYTDMRSCRGGARSPRAIAARAGQRPLLRRRRRHGLCAWCRRSAAPGMPASATGPALGDINARSIGIELVNPGHELRLSARFQRLRCRRRIELCRGHPGAPSHPAHRVLGHSDVAPARKIDPGELFDWRRLARARRHRPVAGADRHADPGACRLGARHAPMQTNSAASATTSAVTGVARPGARARRCRPSSGISVQRRFDGEPDGEHTPTLLAAIATIAVASDRALTRRQPSPT